MWPRPAGCSTPQVYGRDNTLRLDGSPGDTPVTADQNRSLQNQGTNLSISRLVGNNELKAGVQLKRFPIRESFSFGITDPGLNDPASDDYNPNVAPYDLTRGGTLFNFNGEKTGQYYAGYVQDSLHWQNLTVNAGLRYDHNNLFETEKLLQPRIGLAYYVPARRRSCAPRTTGSSLLPSTRTFCFPPRPPRRRSCLRRCRATASLAVVSCSTFPSGTTRTTSASSRGSVPRCGSTFRIGNGSGERGRSGSVLQHRHRLSAQLQGRRSERLERPAGRRPLEWFPGLPSLGHVHALYENPFVGGLFLDAGRARYAGRRLVPDRSRSGSPGTARHLLDVPRSGIWLGVTQRYDSGLVTDAGTIGDVLASPDTAYAAPFIRFDEDPQRVRPRTVWSASLGARLQQYGLPLEIQLDVLNIADKQGLYNFQSVFGGTHVIPRGLSRGVSVTSSED